VDEARLAFRLELAPQVADVDVKRVGVGPEVVAPHDVEDRVARQHASRVRHEHAQELELRPRELDLAIATPALHRVAIEGEIVEVQDTGGAGGAAPPECSEPRQELVQRERLDKVVVRTRVQAFDAISDRRACREHEDRHPVPRRPEAPADLKPIEVRQTEIENDRLVCTGRGHFEPARPLRGRVELVAGHSKSSLERRANARIVLYHEHPHLCLKSRRRVLRIR